ncbi:Hypothetical predicted protein [Olea europaea subsp. europaea]|uniref:Uncharacterized protein n=1 Tax=Olea europaea subsp. europaea TaxID=158383 RepID=A0A8S0UGK7_OLEEU|nr:Hypothetical predicted protein [Olea europaea subsp. europaea]
MSNISLFPFSLSTGDFPFFAPPRPQMSASIFLLWLVSIPLMIHANTQPRGYLLNCGANEKDPQVRRG